MANSNPDVKFSKLQATVLTPQIIKTIVKNHLLSTVITRNWMQFYSALDLDETEKAGLNRQLLMETFNVEELFIRILTAWTDLKGQKATVANLIDILESEQHQMAADKISEHFGKN